MSQYSNYHTLINRGRKAGLNTREIYSAMTTHPPEGGNRSPSQPDSNGYVASVSTEGHATYRPSDVPPA